MRESSCGDVHALTFVQESSCVNVRAEVFVRGYSCGTVSGRFAGPDRYTGDLCWLIHSTFWTFKL